MNKDNEAWYWHNLNVATALILLIAMLALCSLLAPDRKGKERSQCTKTTI